MRRCSAKSSISVPLLVALVASAACSDPAKDGAIEERRPTVDGGHRGYQDARWAEAGSALPGAAGLDDDRYLARPLPVLMIDTGGKTIDRDMEIPARLKVIEDPDASLGAINTRPVTMETAIVIQGRGRSSWEYAQKPYAIELQDGMGNDRARALLGLPSETDFVLHSCYSDKTCMRNALSYAVGRELGRPAGRWSPRTRYVELFVDGMYRGLYLLVERIKRDKLRVNIQAPVADATLGDVTGGYIFSQEGNEVTPLRTWPSAVSTRHHWQHRYPRPEVISAGQRKYLQDAVADFERTLMRDRFGEETRKRIDVASFVDYLLVQELTNNIDAFWKSWFFYKHADGAGGRYIMGPVWDHDLSMGNVGYAKGHCATVLVSPTARSPFRQVFEDESFRNLLRCRWDGLRQRGQLLDIEELEGRIAAFERHIKAAKGRDRTRWQNIGIWIWPNNFVGGGFTDEVNYLRYWLRKRVAWLDVNLPGSCDEVPQPPVVEPAAMPMSVPETMPRGNPMSTMQAQAPSYVPIEGPVPPALANWACPE